MALRNIALPSALVVLFVAAVGLVAESRRQQADEQRAAASLAEDESPERQAIHRIRSMEQDSVLLAQEQESDLVIADVALTTATDGRRLLRIGGGKTNGVESHFWVVDTIRGTYAAFRVNNVRTDARRIANYLRRKGRNVPTDRVEQSILSSRLRQQARQDRRMEFARADATPEDPADGGPSASESRQLPCAGGYAYVDIDVVDPLLVPVNRTEVEMYWDGPTAPWFRVGWCWAKGAAGYPPPLDTDWDIVSCVLNEQYFPGGGFDIQSVGNYINWDFGDNSLSTTTFAMAAANVHPTNGPSWDTFQLSQGEFSSLLFGITYTNVQQNPCPDCSGCVWREGDPIPEGQEVPCGGPNGPGWNAECWCCMGSTPILINSGGGLRLSSGQNGVFFDLQANGEARKWAWPISKGDGWLVLDRNGNGTIDSGRELFGNTTLLANGQPASNGFVALRELDANRDGMVDGRDPAFRQLRVWLETVRDGKSDPNELVRLKTLNISGLAVEATVSKRRDQWGNLFRWRAPVYFDSGVRRFAYDVILTSLSPDGSITYACASAGKKATTQSSMMPDF